MTTILILFGLGVFLLSLEIFLPGGIIGGIGAVFMAAGTYFAFADFGALGGAVALGAAFLLVAGAFYVELIVLPKTRAGRHVLLSAEITGRATHPVDASLIGRTCQAVTVLAPSGMVEIDGRRLEAFCRDGFVEAGTPLIIHGSDNFRLIVSKAS